MECTDDYPGMGQELSQQIKDSIETRVANIQLLTKAKWSHVISGENSSV